MEAEKHRKKEYSATSYALYSVDSEEDHKVASIVSTLPTSNDDDLMRFIQSRLARGSMLPGSGQISSIDLGIEPASCYFCLLNPSQADNGTQYIVCFLTECNRGLESFRGQLDQHAQKIGNVLKEASKDGILDKVKPHLECWYQHCLLFIVNCVQSLGKDIKYVIYNAVANGQMSIDTDDKQLEADLEKFHSSCTLSALLNQTLDSGSDTSGSLVDLDAEPKRRAKRIVDILCVTQRDGEATSFSDRSATKFCEDWAQALFEKLAYSLAEDGEVNPLDLRTISENFKLKTIQDMNSLKRRVKQAELDFYALYRSYLFMRQSGNSQILLMHAMNEEQNQESLELLQLLQDYTDRNQLAPL